MPHSEAELLERYAIRDRSLPRVRANFIASLDGAQRTRAAPAA